MSKLSYEDKINIYQERKNGNAISNISKKYNVRKNVIEYLVRLIDKHGYDVLRISKNRTFTSYEKEQIINRVLLNNESACSVAIDEGLLSQGMLQNWIKKYKENGYNIVERKRGRTTMSKVTKKKENETDNPVLAICYDFDKTLSPDDMQAQGYIQSIDYEVDDFWRESNELSEKNEPLFKQGRINNRRKSKCCKRTSAKIFIIDSSTSVWFS